MKLRIFHSLLLLILFNALAHGQSPCFDLYFKKGEEALKRGKSASGEAQDKAWNEALEAFQRASKCPERKDSLLYIWLDSTTEIIHLSLQKKEERVRKEKEKADSEKALADIARHEAVTQRGSAEKLAIFNHNTSRSMELATEDPAFGWNVMLYLREHGYKEEELASVKYAIGAFEGGKSFYYSTLPVGSYILAAAFLEDNQSVITCSSDDTIRFWSPKGKVYMKKAIKLDTALAIKISPDSRLVAWGQSDNTLHIREINSDMESIIQLSETRISCLAFSPDSRTIAAACKDGNLLVINIENREIESTIDYGYVAQAIAISTGNILLAGGQDMPTAWFDSKTGNPVEIYNRELAALINLRTAQFTGNADYVLVGNNRFDAIFANLTTQETQSLTGHENSLQAIAYAVHPDYPYLLTAGNDKTARLWTTDGKQTTVLKGHKGKICVVAFSRDGKRVLTGDIDGAVKLWLVDNEVKLRFPDNADSHFSVLTFSPDNKYLLAGEWSYGNVSLFSLDGQREYLRSQSENLLDSVRALAFSPDGKEYVSILSDGTAHVRETVNGKLLKMLTPENKCFSVCYSNHEKIILTGMDNGNVAFWNTDTWEFRTEHSLFPGEIITGINFTKDDRRIVAVTAQGNIGYFKASTGGKIREIGKHRESIRAATISHDGNYVVTNSDHETKRWSLENPSDTILLDGHKNNVSGVAFSPDDQYILTCSWDKTAIVWTKKGNKMYRTNNPQSGSLAAVAASHDGKYFATGSNVITLYYMPDYYQQAVVPKLPLERLFENGVILDSTEINAITDLDATRKAAAWFKNREMWERAEKLYKRCTYLAKHPISHTKPTAEDSIDILRSFLGDMTEQFAQCEDILNLCEMQIELGNKNAFFRLIETTNDEEDLEAYGDYFYERAKWAELKALCERHRKVTGNAEIWNKRQLYVTKVELNNRNESPGELIESNNEEELLETVNFFVELGYTSEEIAYRKQRNYDLAVFEALKKLMAIAPENEEYIDLFGSYASDLGWFHLLNGEPDAGLKAIEAGLHTYKKKDNTQKFLRMNHASALLISGRTEEAKKIYLYYKDSTFMDYRYKNMAEAFLADFEEFRKAEKVVGKNILPSTVQEIEALLGAKPSSIENKVKSVNEQPINPSAMMGYKDGSGDISLKSQPEYIVVTGSFANEANARNRLKKVQNAGFADARIIKNPEATLYTVVASRFKLKKDAYALKAELEKRYDIEALVKPIYY